MVSISTFMTQTVLNLNPSLCNSIAQKLEGFWNLPVGIILGKGLDCILFLQHPGVEDSLGLEAVPDALQETAQLLAHLCVDHGCGKLGLETAMLRVEIRVLKVMKT